MKTVGIREAKPRFSALVRAAAEGETTLITDYGKPVAVIAPLEPPPAVSREPGVENTAAAAAPPPSAAAAFLEALLNPPFDLNFDF